jgi:hypothetical protein
MTNGKFTCPCCGHATLDERAGYDICPVCFWEDDGQDEPHADEEWRGPNRVSLTSARRNYLTVGASEERLREHVRAPASIETRQRIFTLTDDGLVTEVKVVA